MSFSSEKVYDLPVLRALLKKNGLIQTGDKIKLVPYEPAFLRRHDYMRWHYRVDVRRKPVCHLVVGTDLTRLHAKAIKIARACPDLVCSPIIFQHDPDGPDYLCLEHFAGESLDEAVQKGRCTPAQWLEHVRRAHHLLDRTKKPSNHARLEKEINNLLNDICSFPGFCKTDSLLLRKLAGPVLLANASDSPPETRWSNGDFVGRNLLINPHGDIRLIDYEYAAPTHFGNSDWLRLMEFSILPSGLDLAGIEELASARQPLNEAHLWLHHLSLLKHVEPFEVSDPHIASTVSRLFQSINRAADQSSGKRKYSFMLEILAGGHDRIESLVAERTAWAQSLDAELSTTLRNFKKLQAEHAERTAWAQSLDAELSTTLRNFKKLQAEHAERTAWAQSLDAELQKAGKAAAEQKKVTERLTTAFYQLSAEIMGSGKSDESSEHTAARSQGTGKRRVTSPPPDDHGTGEREILEKCTSILADLRRDLAIKAGEANASAGAALDAGLRASAAESEARRLKVALADAQVHVDNLLQQAEHLQQGLNALDAAKLDTENTLLQREQELQTSLARLQDTRMALARYERLAICRFVARLSSPPPAPSLHR